MAQPNHENPLPSTDDTKVIFICSVCSNRFTSLHEAQNHPGCWRETRDKTNQRAGIPETQQVGDNQQSLEIQQDVGELGSEILEKNELSSNVHENESEPTLEVHENVGESSLQVNANVGESSLEVHENVGQPRSEIHENVAESSLQVNANVGESSSEVRENVEESSLQVNANVAESSLQVHENVGESSLQVHENVGQPSSEVHMCRVCNLEFGSEESLLVHCKTHEEPVPVIPDNLQPETDKVPESKEVYLKIETDQGEFCVQLNANDIYNLSEQKVALDLDSIAKSNSASNVTAINSNPIDVTTSLPLSEKLHSINNKTNYVLDLLQEKLHNTDKGTLSGKNTTPVLVDADTKVNKPVEKVIDEIIKRNENITTNRKSADSSVLHSDVSKNKPVNQIIDEIIQRNENVTRKTQSKNSYKPRLCPKPESDHSVISLESALPGNIQPGSRLMIGGTTYEILYTSNDESNTPSVAQTNQSESNMIYIVDDTGGTSQNAEQAYNLSNMAEVAELNTTNTFDGTVPIGQITNNQPNQNPVHFVDDIFTYNNGTNESFAAKRGRPRKSTSPQPTKILKTDADDVTNNRIQVDQSQPHVRRETIRQRESVQTFQPIEEEKQFVPAPVILEPDDVLPEKGSMPDDLYDMIMSHLTQPKPRIYKCTMCHRSFQTEGKLKKHVDFDHKDEPPLTCKVCNTSRTYKSRAALENHLRAHEREEEIAKRLKMNEEFQSQEETSNYICKFATL